MKTVLMSFKLIKIHLRSIPPHPSLTPLSSLNRYLFRHISVSKPMPIPL